MTYNNGKTDGAALLNNWRSAREAPDKRIQGYAKPPKVITGEVSNTSTKFGAYSEPCGRRSSDGQAWVHPNKWLPKRGLLVTATGYNVWGGPLGKQVGGMLIRAELRLNNGVVFTATFTERRTTIRDSRMDPKAPCLTERQFLRELGMLVGEVLAGRYWREMRSIVGAL